VREVLVVANRTLGGAKLLEAVRSRAADGATRFRLVVPQSDPSAGLVIYDEAVRESAQARVDLALELVTAEGIDASGEVGDSDPFLATMDAVAERRPDEVIISTPPRRQLRLAATRPGRTDPQRLGAARRARCRRHRAGGPALQGHTRARLKDARRRRAAEPAEGEGRKRRPTAVRRDRAAARRQRRRAAARTRSPCHDARQAAQRGPVRLGA